MVRYLKVSVILVCICLIPEIGHAQRASVDIIKQGLLGAGTGAISGAVSGAKSEDLWISAITGAGVNIIGGSLLDIMTNGDDATASYQPSGRVMAYRIDDMRKKENRNIRYYPVRNRGVRYSADFLEGYKAGFNDGYIKGYRDAFMEIAGND